MGVTGRRIRVGILDSGIDVDHVNPVDGRSFAQGGDGTIRQGRLGPDRLNHGTVIADTILKGVSSADFIVAQVFSDRMTTTPAVVAAGLDWLVGKGAEVVTMSFGLRADRTVLRDACARARMAGCVLLAASPARGGVVFPAAYPGVISVTGDARLDEGEVSSLGPDGHFGAYAWPGGLDPSGAPRTGGASFAVATVAVRVADYLLDHAGAGSDDSIRHLESIARFTGPERRA